MLSWQLITSRRGSWTLKGNCSTPRSPVMSSSWNSRRIVIKVVWRPRWMWHRRKPSWRPARAQAIDVREQRTQFEHAIAVLIGEPASNFTLSVVALNATPPIIPPGLPSELLERRPDIAANERLMASANAGSASRRQPISLRSIFSQRWIRKHLHRELAFQPKCVCHCRSFGGGDCLRCRTSPCCQ